MSIASEIIRIKNNIQNVYQILADKGATLPEVLNSDNLVACAETAQGGASSMVINKTGTTINKGDKVWLNENAQVSGTGFYTKNGLTDYSTFITRNGNCMYTQVDNIFYSITSSGLTEIQTLSTGSAVYLKYMANGTTFLANTSTNTNANYRIDENLVASLPNNYYPICEDLFMKYNTNWYLYKLNLDTFEEVKGWYFENNALTSGNIFIIGNKLYV